MSSYNVISSTRLRAQLESLGISIAEAARRAGEKDPERLKQVMAGRQRCPIDLLAALFEVGVDVQYVVTGQRSGNAISQDEVLLLERYRASPRDLRDAALRVLLGAGSQNGQFGRFEEPSAIQSAVITGNKNSVNQSQGGASGKSRKPKRSD